MKTLSDALPAMKNKSYAYRNNWFIIDRNICALQNIWGRSLNCKSQFLYFKVIKTGWYYLFYQLFYNKI